MNLHLLFEKGKMIRVMILSACGIYLSIHYSEACYRGIAKGLSFSINVLIPSLFFFMVIAAFLIRSDIALILSRPFNGIARLLFKLPPVSVVVILLSMLGGYPIGARCVASLHERGILSQRQAQKTAYIAVAAGPGFILNYIGEALLNSPSAGRILLISQVVSVLLTGMIVGRAVKCEPDSPISCPRPGGNLLVEAVTDASKGAFFMCSMVLLFSALTETASQILSSSPSVVDILSGVMEVTIGCNRTAGRYPIFLIAFFIGFGGFSVHYQIFASLKELPLRHLLFIIFRAVEGILSAVSAYILVSLFPETEAVFSTAGQQAAVAASGPLWGSLALTLSALVFLGAVSQGGSYVRNSRNHLRQS